MTRSYGEQQRARNPVAAEKARVVVDAANLLELALEERGLTRSELAQRLNRSKQIISRQLNGTENLSLGKFAEIAFALGKRVEIDLSNLSSPAIETPSIRLIFSQPTPMPSARVNVRFAESKPLQNGGSDASDGLRTTKHEYAA